MKKVRKVFKYPLIVTDRQPVRIPVGHEFISLGVQDDTACLWAIVDPLQDLETIQILIHGTGHTIYETAGEFLGTFQLADGKFTGHVWKEIAKGFSYPKL